MRVAFGYFASNNTERYADDDETRALSKRALEGVRVMHAVHHGEGETENAVLSGAASTAYGDIADVSLTLDDDATRALSKRALEGVRVMHAVHHGEGETENAVLSGATSTAYGDIADVSLTLESVP